MAITTQQLNTTSRLITALTALKDAYYDAIEAKDAAALIGIPAANEFPAGGGAGFPGDLDHVNPRVRLVYGHGVVDALKTWMTTPIDLDGAGAAANKAPLDAIFELIR